jgi:uncharacterized membrane protein YqgA involved in biofilm formation
MGLWEWFQDILFETNQELLSSLYIIGGIILIAITIALITLDEIKGKLKGG